MKKYIRIILVVVASLAVLGVAARYFIEWSVEGAFQSGSKGARQVADAFEASLGSTLARGDVQLQPGPGRPEGMLPFYQKNPQALERDKKYFETWYSALAIADAGRKTEHQQGEWVSSAVANWIVPSQRMDAWGHAFCVRSDQHRTIVVSAGPQALSSLDCNTLKVSGEELARMPQARLNSHASGALILFVKDPGDGPSDTVDPKSASKIDK